jgi:hypothetical protein
MRQYVDEPGMDWKPLPGSVGMTLSYELRPGGNRPGPKDAWDRFDRVVVRLGAAIEGTSASAVAGVLHDLANAMADLADAIDSRPLPALGPRDDGLPDEPADTDSTTDRSADQSTDQSTD